MASSHMQISKNKDILTQEKGFTATELVWDINMAVA